MKMAVLWGGLVKFTGVTEVLAASIIRNQTMNAASTTETSESVTGESGRIRKRHLYATHKYIYTSFTQHPTCC
jgi:hypothetical protein